ncbi:MAG TPA: hypothetical protein PK590_02805, partial [Candidatus Omnitrophota bacterium]|nr:hypothetical protein [Candidatus Omnitrophota bacterium]
GSVQKPEETSSETTPQVDGKRGALGVPDSNGMDKLYQQKGRRSKEGVEISLARALALDENLPDLAAMREELKLRLEVQKAAGKYSFNDVVNDDSLASWAKEFRKIQERFYPKEDFPDFTVDKLFEIAESAMGLRAKAGRAIAVDFASFSNGLSQPSWMMPEDLNTIEARVKDLAKGRVTLEDAVELFRDFAREQKLKGQSKEGYGSAVSWMQERAKQRLLLQAAYQVSHKDSQGRRMTAEDSDISPWVTLVKNGFAPLYEFAGILKYDGTFQQKELALRDAVVKAYKEKNGSATPAELEAMKASFPIMDDWQRMGFAARMYELGHQTDWLDRWFASVEKIQLASWTHTGHFIDPMLISFAVKRFARADGSMDWLDNWRMNKYLATIEAYNDLAFMDLGSEAGDLARLLWSWRVVFNAVPTEKERENLLSLWKDLGKQDYLKTASVSERQTAERSLVSRILMVRDTFSDVYAANHGNEEPPQELLEAITGIAAQPILRMLDRMAERRDGVIAFRAEQDKEKAALEPHRVSSRDWYSRKQETVDVKTLLTNLTTIAQGYSMSLSEADRTLLMKRVDKDTAQMLSEKMQLRGYDAHDAFVLYVWLPFRVEKVYREVSRIGGESFLTSDQRGEVAAYASMIFRDWGFLLNEGHEKERLEAEEALSKTIEQGITGRIEQLRIQIERSRIYKEKFDTAFPQLGTQLTSQDAFLWAEKARSSALSDDEFQQWIDLAKELKVVDDSLTIKQALALADQWLRIGLAEELPEHYWNQDEAETIFKATFTNEQFKQAQKSGPEDSEVLRGWLQRRDRGFRSLDDPELITALAQGSVSRNISPLLFARRAQQAIYARDMIDRAAQFNNALSKNDKRYDPAGIERFSVSDLLVYYDAIAPNSKGFDLVSTLEQTGRGEKVFGEQANRLWEDRVEASINAAFRVEHEKILRPLLPPATEPAVRQEEKKEAPSLDQRIRKLIWEKIQEPALKALPGTNDLTTSEAPSRSEMRVSMELGFSSFVQFLWHSVALTNALWITLIVGVIVFLYDFVHKSAFSRAIGDEASRPGFWKWRAFWSVTFFTTVLTQMVYISVINPGAYYLTALTASVLISVYLIWAISYKFWGWIITSLYPLYSLIVDGLWKRGILRDKSSRVTAEPIMRPIFNADDSDFQLVSENGRRIYYLTEAFFEREYPEASVREDMKAKLGWVGRDGGVHPGTQINAVQMLLRPDRDDKYPEEQESIAFW